jgi:hypothetical protein
MHKLLLALLLGIIALPCSQAATATAPDLVLTGTFTATIVDEEGIHAARLYIDGALVASRDNQSTQLLVLEAPIRDGAHTFRVDVDADLETGETVRSSFSGFFTAQNIAPVLSGILEEQGAGDTRVLVQQALQAAEEARREAHNATLAIQALPLGDLAHRSDLADVARTATIRETAQGLQDTLDAGQGNQDRELAALRGHLEGLERSFTVLVVLLALTTGMLLYSVLRLRRLDDEPDRIPQPTARRPGNTKTAAGRAAPRIKRGRPARSQEGFEITGARLKILEADAEEPEDRGPPA